MTANRDILPPKVTRGEQREKKSVSDLRKTGEGVTSLFVARFPPNTAGDPRNVSDRMTVMVRSYGMSRGVAP